MAGSTSAPGAMNSGGNDLGGLGSMIAALTPLLFGGGNKNTTSTQTSSIPPEIQQLLQSIIGTATTNANDPTKTNGIVQDILTKTGISLAPQIKAGASSGLYNSETTSLLAQRATADATAAASKATLDYQTAQQGIAANTAAQLGNMSKTITDTSKTRQQSIIPTSGTGLALSGLAAYSIYNKRKSITDSLGLTTPDTNKLIPPVNGGVPTGDISNIIDPANFGSLNIAAQSSERFGDTAATLSDNSSAINNLSDSVNTGLNGLNGLNGTSDLTDLTDTASNPLLDAFSSVGSSVSDGFQKLLSAFSF